MKTYIVIVDDYGTKRWYLNGDNLHCEDGPAIEHDTGVNEWYLNGKLHRTDGPAVVHPNGTNEWYLNGKRHRTDGPALEYDTGGEYWYLDGVKYTEADWRKQLQKKVKAPCVGKVIEIDGVKYKLIEA